MKKFFCLIIAAGVALALCACGESVSGKNTGVTSGVADVIEQQINGGTETEAETAAAAAVSADTQAAQVSYDNVDVDLTAISSTMVYSEVYNMMNAADSYVGKVVKMSGQFAAYEFPEITYYACIIADATACCQQGMEFVLAGNQAYPSDGEQITVTGVFELYQEDTTTYCHLTNAVLE